MKDFNVDDIWDGTVAEPSGVSQIDAVQHDDTNRETRMAPKETRGIPTPDLAGPVSDATADATVEKPYGPGKEFATERDYIQSRVKQARGEAQAHLNAPEEGTPGGAPSVETLPGASSVGGNGPDLPRDSDVGRGANS